MVWLKGEFVIVKRYWTDEKDENRDRIYAGVVRYVGDGRFDNQTAEIRIGYSKHVKAGRALDDMVKKANLGLPHVRSDLKIKNLEEFMRVAGGEHSARLMRGISEG